MKDRIAKGSRYFVFILAVLSVNLGLLNLLPIPSLDGIKMAFLAVEGAMRRDLHAGFQVWVNAAGLLLLLGLMVVLMARDTLRLFE
jgi:regulator of sigma E protease